MSDRWCIVPATRRERREYIGTWHVLKYRKRVQVVGVRAVAAQLKKQGVPLDVTLRVLGIQPTRY